jgi:hypothetical protein
MISGRGGFRRILWQGLEECFAVNTVGIAETVRLGLDVGLAGCSIEDWDSREQRLYEVGEAAERVATAAEDAHAGGVHFVLTARAENYLRAATTTRTTHDRAPAGPIKRPAPTCCTRPHSTARRICASCSRRWTSPSACLRGGGTLPAMPPPSRRRYNSATIG